MTQDEIIRMAREAELYSYLWGGDINQQSLEAMERFAALVAAHERERVMSEPLTKAMWERFESEVRKSEREACAKVCEENAKEWSDGNNDWCSGQVTGSNDCAATIRARGETK